MCWVLGSPAAQAVTIAAVTPQGEVAQVRQVTVKFSAAVVAFGDLRLPDPVTVTCTRGAPAGSGRWANDRVWLYDFTAALPPGTSCSVKPRADWTPIQGTLSGPARETTFSTGGPAVVATRPGDGSQIAQDQYFLLRLNGAAEPAGVVAHSWCEVQGLGERIGVHLVDGQARAQVLTSQHLDAAAAARVVVLACQRPLPSGAAVRLVWGAGIASVANPKIVTRAEQSFSYTVQPAFSADFSCERERATAPCLPIRPVTLRFSAPVPRTLAATVRLLGPSGLSLAPVFDKDDHATDVQSLSFPTPLPDSASFRIELPAELKDDAGRALANAGAFPLSFATGEAPPIAKFAAAPFGIVELSDPVLPVTLRHVQGDLRPQAASGQVRIKTLHTDADILEWYRRVQRFDETQLSAKELGWPQAQWMVTDSVVDGSGKRTTHRHERFVATREVSLLDHDPAARRLDLPQLVAGDPRPFEVVGLPLAEPGYHVVEIESLRLGQSLLDKRAPMYVRTGVLVTNLGVHLKLGRENSVAWVTTLDRGKPVAGALVAVSDCRGKVLWSGATDDQGLARMGAFGDAARLPCPSSAGLMVSARKADAHGVTDTAFVFSQWQKGIEAWRFNVPTASAPSPDVRASTVLDRTLLRAGETVSMKHFVRLETSAGLALLAPDALPTHVKIVHQGSGQEYVVPLSWSGARSAQSSWVIPAAAKLGVYDVLLARPGRTAGGQTEPARQWHSADFRVEEFRIPLVDARVSGPKGPNVAPKELAVSVQLNYFSGGAMAQVPARASALLQPRTLNFNGYDEYSFEPPREPGRDDARAAGEDEEPDADSAASPASARLIADKLAVATDRQGAATLVLRNLPTLSRPSEVAVEVTFNDPNGEAQTAKSTMAVWPSAVVLGLRAQSWASARGKVQFDAVALDTSGAPIKGQPVEIRGRLAQVISTRKRMVGGFYAYDNRTDHQELGVLCSGQTDDHGLLACDASLDMAGQVELIASSKDAQQHPAQAATSVWVTRQGELWFAQDNDDRIDVLPEKKHYEPGETARLQVRMPFREATALVAVEREGILSTRVVTLRGDDPTVEVKIEPSWGPNVYVSVLALRGRLRQVPWYSFFTWGWSEPLSWLRSFWYAGREYQAPTAMVDLSKPAFKLGVATLKVGIRAHELHVSVSADRAQYAVRQKAVARIQVTFDGQPAALAQVAFAAVDEGLLALRGNESWDLLNAMIQTRAWGVETSTAQSEIIGRRHYGRKAVAAGGGGGRGGTRELFDTLLLWRGDVTLDAQGRATIEVPLNDSLTSFRLVAVADSGAQQFGTGSTSIRVSQDLQVLSGLPLMVREGDRFAAMLTLRNTTTRAMNVHATLQGTPQFAAGRPGAPAPVTTPPRDLVLAGGAAQELVWPVAVPDDVAGMVWEAAVEEQAGATGVERARDRLKVTQQVGAAVPIRVLQATLQQLEGTLTLPIAAPADALASRGVARGGLLVAVQPKITGALPGMRRYFETYPFTCLEQKTSKSVGLNDAAMWAAVANALPTYLDSDGLAGYFPPREQDPPHGSDRLTAYVLAATHEAGFELPAAARDAMLAGLTAFVEGRLERTFWSPAAARGNDLAVRKLAAIEALARYGRASPKMLGSIRLTPNVWPTAAVIDWLRILRQLDGIADRTQRLDEANQILRARLTYSGTTLKFSNEDDDFWWWQMDSADANAARLVLAVLDDPSWRDDLPRMVVGALGRQRAGAWLTTTANLWGSLALNKFSAKFESTPVAGRTAAMLGEQTGAIDWAGHPQGGSLQLAWPTRATPLNVAQDGTGKPWLTVQSLAAVPLKAPLHAGYSVTRSVSAVEQKSPGVWSRGDVLRVHVDIDAQSDMTWVVVSDPVPAGATILGSGLGNDTAIATRGERRSGTAWASFEERSLQAYRSYFEFLPRGKHAIEYTVRLNNPGTFSLPPTRAQAMYAPEVFGESPNAAVDVRP